MIEHKPMDSLEAQAKAARLVRSLSRDSQVMMAHLQRIHQTDQELRALRPHLTEAAVAEVEKATSRLSDNLADGFFQTLNGRRVGPEASYPQMEIRDTEGVAS